MPPHDQHSGRQQQVCSVTLTTPDGVLRGKVAIDTGPMRLAELAPTACELTDVLVGRAVARENKAGRTLSCRAGCGACCRQMVPLAPPEALYLAEIVNAMPEGIQRDVRSRFETVVQALEDKGMVSDLLDPEIGEEPVMAIARDYFRLGIPCPILVDESCTIHPDRPVACREFNVTSPAEWCADPYAQAVARIPMPTPLSAPLARLTAQLTGEKARLIPLPLALRWADQHADLAGKTWPGPELFALFMKELSSTPV